VSATLPQTLAAFDAHRLDTRRDKHDRSAWETDCPVCRDLSDATWPVRITEAWPGGPVVLRCISGCDQRAILAAVGLGPDPDRLAAAGALGPGLERVDLAALRDAPVEPLSWLAEGVLAPGMLTLLSGRETTGKSTVASALASAVSRGTDVAGIACRRCPVLVLDAENPPWVVKARVHAFDPDLSAFEHVAVEPGVFQLAHRLAEVEALIAAIGAGLLVLDSLASLVGDMDENSAASVEGVLGRLRALLRRRDCAGLLLHHAAKGNDGEGFRGSTAISAGVDLRYVLTRRTERLTLTCRKSRPAPEAGPFHLSMRETPSGLAVLEAAEPTRAGRDTDGDDRLAQRLGEAAAGRGELRKAALCAAAGVAPNAGTTARAIRRALADRYLVKIAHGFYEAGPNAGDSSIHPPAEGGEGGWMNAAKAPVAAA
jgi:hypothetical protein